MVNPASNRALRAMDLIPYVLENPGVSTAELAQNFSVSIKQIEEDLSLIFMCGLPGYTPYDLIDLVFEDGVVSVIDPQVLTKPRNFSKTEHVAVVLGLEILKSLIPDSPDYQARILQVLSKINKSIPNVEVIIKKEKSFQYFETINQAIKLKQILKIVYNSESKDEQKARSIAPLRMYLQNAQAYLVAYDPVARIEKVFKLSNISSCEIGEISDMSSSMAEEELVKVEIVVDEKHLFFVERNSSIIVAQQQIAGGIKVILKVRSMDWIKRAIVSNAPGIQVISPPELASWARETASKMISLYAKTGLD
jgi:proteasome accessory factor C